MRMDFRSMQKRYLIDGYPNRGLVFVRGEGAYLYTETGERYLDMMSNYGVNILGYGDRAVREALVAQLDRLTTLHCSFTNDCRAEASRLLVERLGGAYRRVYWSSSGTEAIEAAIKFAVAATGRRRFIACRNAYHGKTLGALSATYDPKYRAPFEPLLWDFRHVEFGSAQALDECVDGETAAFIVEPIQGESGIRLPPAGYLRAVREICDRRGILLILDEVQTGAGRTGRFLASEHDAIQADVVCLGKGIAGGIPAGMTMTTESLAQRMGRSTHTSTFGGNPLACAGTRAVLETLDTAMLAEVESKGAHLLSLLKRIDSPLIRDVRGRGLMVGVELAERRDDILKRLQAAKVLAIPAGDSVVRLLPPYVITRDQLAHAATTFAGALTSG